MFDQIIELDHFVNARAQVVFNKQTTLLVEDVFGIYRCFRICVYALGFRVEAMTWVNIQEIVLE